MTLLGKAQMRCRDCGRFISYSNITKTFDGCYNCGIKFGRKCPKCKVDGDSIKVITGKWYCYFCGETTK